MDLHTRGSRVSGPPHQAPQFEQWEDVPYSWLMTCVMTSKGRCLPSPSVDLGVTVTDLYALTAADVDLVLAAREPGTLGIWG